MRVKQPFAVYRRETSKPSGLAFLDLVQHPHLTDEKSKPKQPLTPKHPHRFVKVSRGIPTADLVSLIIHLNVGIGGRSRPDPASCSWRWFDSALVRQRGNKQTPKRDASNVVGLSLSLRNGLGQVFLSSGLPPYPASGTTALSVLRLCRLFARGESCQDQHAAGERGQEAWRGMGLPHSLGPK